MTTEESSVSEDPVSEGEAAAQDGDADQQADGPEAPGESGDDPNAIPADSVDAYKIALDAYLGGDLRRALEIVDHVLQADSESELRPRLERLRRRAEDRIAKEVPPEEAAVEAPADGKAEEPAAEAVTAAVEETDAPSGDASATEPASDEPASDEPASDEPATDESASDESGRVEASASDEPAVEASAADEPAVEAPASEAPASDEPAVEAPASDEPGRVEADESGRVEAKTESGRAAKAEPGRVEAPASDESGRVDKQPEGRVIQKRSSSGPQRPGRKAPPMGKKSRRGGVQRRVSTSGSHAASGSGAHKSSSVKSSSVKADLDRMNNTLNKLANSFRVVEGSVVKVAEAYRGVARNHKRKEQAYDQLYEELRGYKENFLLAAQKPVFKDIILLFDGIRRTMTTIEEMGEKLDKAEVQGLLKHLQDEVLEVLYRRDIEVIEEHPKVLDIDFQKPVRRVETDNPDEDREIVQVVREGFRMNGTLMRAQEVIVKRCVKERESE